MVPQEQLEPLEQAIALNRRCIMKQLIIITGTILLGTLLFQMMVGDGPDSLKTAVRRIMIQNIEEYAVWGD